MYSRYCHTKHLCEDSKGGAMSHKLSVKVYSKTGCKKTLYNSILVFDLKLHPGAWTLWPKHMAWKQAL